MRIGATIGLVSAELLIWILSISHTGVGLWETESGDLTRITILMIYTLVTLNLSGLYIIFLTIALGTIGGVAISWLIQQFRQWATPIRSTGLGLTVTFLYLLAYMYIGLWVNSDGFIFQAIRSYIMGIDWIGYVMLLLTLSSGVWGGHRIGQAARSMC